VRLILLLFSSIIFIEASAQKLSGRIFDADNDEPLPFANVSLLQLGDSSVVTGGVTDFDGRFSFDAEPGKYIFRAGFVGYRHYFESLTVANQNIRVKDILLRPTAAALQEVEVRASALLFETDIDKRIYNVENSIVAEGGTAADVLSTLPSIQVDEEGGISMRGSGAVLIYINGRPSNLSSDEMESILEQLPANSVKSVELITNPSSRYDAQGVAGIINIILKKNEVKGFNGSANVSAGTRYKYQAGINMNYNAGKINFYGSYNYQDRNLFAFSESLRENFLPGISPFLDQDFYTTTVTRSNFARAGFDYEIGERSVLGMYTQFNYSERDRFRTYNQRFNNAQFTLDSLNVRTLDEDQSSRNLETGITYFIDIDSMGQTLYASGSYATNRQKRIEYIDQRYFNSASQEDEGKQLLQNYGRPSTRDMWIMQLDYTKPLRNNDGLEAGFKSTLSNRFNEQQFDQLNLNTGLLERNDTVSDQFNFTEHVHAAYLNYRARKGKFGFQGGLRAELTLTEGEQFNFDTTYVNNYFNVFPSAYFSYHIRPEEELQLNYSRRISRPGGWSLSPFYNVQDLLNLRIGNPYLQPEFTDSYEAAYLKGWDKLFFTSTVYHRRSTDVISRIITLNDQNQAIQTWANADIRKSTGLELIQQFQPSSNFDLMLSGNFFYSEIIGDNISEGFNNSNFSWTLSFLSNIQIPRVVAIQVQADYRGPIVLPQGEIEPIYGVNIGLRKEVLNRKGSVSMNISDLFNTRVFKVRTDDIRFSQERMFNRETRIATLTFTYRFGGFRDKRNGGDRDDYGDDPF
jgi:iron complex outermembrane recepter protein